jgi:hypothetical protein
MPYARNWVSKVDWYIDNTDVINNFRRMPRWVANDWSKAGDRDVNGYIDVIHVMRKQVKVSGRCTTNLEWRSARSTGGRTLGQ